MHAAAILRKKKHFKQSLKGKVEQSQASLKLLIHIYKVRRSIHIQK